MGTKRSTPWGAMHLNVAVRGSDGFTMCKMKYYATNEFYLELLNKLGMEPQGSTSVAAYTPGRVRTHLAAFLRLNCADSFCISFQVSGRSWEGRAEDPSATFYIGFRDPRDFFKFSLKIPGCKRTRTWSSKLGFVFIGKEDDPFRPPSKAGTDWNQEDPQGGMIR